MNNYKKPLIPIAPVLSAFFRLFFRAKDLSSYPSLLSANSVRMTTSGRMGIALALEHAGIGKGDRVLVPAFHCSSMIEPVIWSGAEPVFYRIRKDTGVDMADVESKLDSSVKMIMVTHFFGFHQDMKSIKAFCDERGILILEDCAHGFFGSLAGKPIGSWGDYAIGSSMKFFPVYDGGCLVSDKRDLSTIQLTSAGKSFELKALLNAIENAREYKRLKLLNTLIHPLLWLKDFVWKLLKRNAGDKSTLSIGPGASDGGFDFEEAWVHKSMSTISEFIVSHIPKRKMVERRLENYRFLEESLSELEGIRPLHPSLPEGTVPYVYSVYVENPGPVFHDLKTKRVPIIRFGEFLWEGVDETVCPVSVEYSQHIFQFPCHQEFRQSELDWMVTEIKNTLKNYK
ncbi:MAG: aminotransferase class I/II-fold pyridoxal phosphate-dependent enzyme [Gammaproteobacteria bacterium]|nr:aminotransferase class I/II-fold pyridoxal phosphate-dependent enzyme [Gammaproteobacteria bacterium]